MHVDALAVGGARALEHHLVGDGHVGVLVVRPELERRAGGERVGDVHEALGRLLAGEVLLARELGRGARAGHAGFQGVRPHCLTIAPGRVSGRHAVRAIAYLQALSVAMFVPLRTLVGVSAAVLRSASLRGSGRSTRDARWINRHPRAAPARTGEPPDAGWSGATRCSGACRRPLPAASSWCARRRAAARRSSCARGSSPSAATASPGSRSSAGERDAQRFWLSVVDALAGAVAGAGLVERVSRVAGVRRRGGGRAAAVRAAVAGRAGRAGDRRSARAALARRAAAGSSCSSPGCRRSCAWCWRRARSPGSGCIGCASPGELTEVRATPICASRSRRRASCWRRAGVALSDEGLALLHERTEGWAAGLRLAAISLAGHPDPERFVREFSGSERTVAGYLLAEVLERQPPEVRELLLRTSVLERVSGPLADVLTGGAGSERILQELEDANAFVTSLDAGRSWFRYHHLFADLLRLELRRRRPGARSARCTARPPQWHERARVRRRGDPARAGGARLGVTRPACSPTTSSSLILDGRRATLAALLAAFPAERRGATPSSRSPPPTLGSRRSARRQRARTSPPPSGRPPRCPTTGGGSSTCGWAASPLWRRAPARRSRHRARRRPGLSRRPSRPPADSQPGRERSLSTTIERSR